MTESRGRLDWGNWTTGRSVDQQWSVSGTEEATGCWTGHHWRWTGTQWASVAVNHPIVTAHDVVQLCCCGLCGCCEQGPENLNQDIFNVAPRQKERETKKIGDTHQITSTTSQ
jgi:hypothetical protein